MSLTPSWRSAMDKIFILHADHEQNASTSTVRIAGSSGANPYAVIAAGIASLWGPAHGGANEAVLSMLDEIGDQVAHSMNSSKRPKIQRRQLPPHGLRSPGLQKLRPARHASCSKRPTRCLDLLGVSDPRLELARELERIALEDDYFVQRVSCTRTSISTPASSSRRWASRPRCSPCCSRWPRTVGWISQWKEMMEHPDGIFRPRQLYTGEKAP